MTSRQGRHCYTYQQAADLIAAMSDDDEETNDIIVIPCNERGDQESEADDLDEENLFSDTLGDVAGLLEIQEDDCNTEVENQPPAKRRRTSPTSWKKSEVTDSFSNLRQFDDFRDEYPLASELTAFETFRLFVDDSFIHHIVTETNRYAHEQNNNPLFSVSFDEIEQFLGVLLYSGYVCLPEERNYWSRSEDINFDFLSSSITRDR